MWWFVCLGNVTIDDAPINQQGAGINTQGSGIIELLSLL